MNKRIVYSAIACVCGKCLRHVPQGSAIWYEGGLSNVDGCPQCDDDCRNFSASARTAYVAQTRSTADNKCKRCDRPKGYTPAGKCLADVIHDRDICYDHDSPYCRAVDWRKRALDSEAAHAATTAKLGVAVACLLDWDAHACNSYRPGGLDRVLADADGAQAGEAWAAAVAFIEGCEAAEVRPDRHALYVAMRDAFAKVDARRGGG
jgi:hypothetical protein